MDYDIVSNSVQHAYRNFRNNDANFNSAMSIFYEEGAKNPSVPRIILQEQVMKRQIAVNEMLKDVVAIQNAFLYILMSCQHLFMEVCIF